MKIISAKQTASKKPNRFNWVVLSYLYVLLFINGFATLQLMTLLYYNDQVVSNISLDTVKILLPVVLANVFFLSLLVKQKKIGFWGYLICGLLSIAVSIYLGEALLKSIQGIIGILFLFGLLQMGGRDKAWNKLN